MFIQHQFFGTGIDMLRRIDHPFLLADNRHYTFYIWRRLFKFHFMVPYLLAPIYLACAWAWFLRLGEFWE